MVGYQCSRTGKSLSNFAECVADGAQTGLVPSNYLSEIDDDGPASAAAAPAPAPMPAVAPAPAAGSSKEATATATALYDYEAGEDNELSFPEDAIITNLVSASKKLCTCVC